MATRESQMRSSVEQSSVGPGIQPGGIAGSTNLIYWPTSAEQSREGHGIKPVGISGSASGGKGQKRKLALKSYMDKYQAICEVERGLNSKKQIAEAFGVPQNTLSTWLKNKEAIKAKFPSGELEPERKNARTVCPHAKMHGVLFVRVFKSTGYYLSACAEMTGYYLFGVLFVRYPRQTLEETEESTKAQQHLDYVEKLLRKKLFFSNALVQSDLMSFF